MLVHRIVVGETATLRLLGPGDVVGAPPAVSSMLVSAVGWRAAAPTRMAVLGREVLIATHRAPRFAAGLQARSTEQADRVALQLAICQLPRVEDRVLSVLWLLSESWGQVTSGGTALRLHLTHETLGGLVGARRSTVTLALGQLTETGAILRQERGWLLLKRPPAGIELAPPTEQDPELLERLRPAERVRRVSPATAEDVGARVQELLVSTEQLRGIGNDARRRLQRDLRRLVETRRRSQELWETNRARRESGWSAGARLHHDDARDGLGTVERKADHPAAKRLPSPVDGIDG
jgi:CRP-like cAMP-binding protein